MFIPPGKVYQDKLVEVAGLWWVKMYNKISHLVIKLPTNIIKSINKNINVSLTLSIWNYNKSFIMCYGLIIYDDLLHPFIVNQTVNNKQEYTELIETLTRDELVVHFFDELCRPVVSSNCIFDDEQKNVLKQFLNGFEGVLNFNEENKYNDELHELFYKDFDIIISGSKSKTNILERFFKIDCKFEFNEPNNIYSIDGSKFILNDKNEGSGLEQSIYQVLENVYDVEKVYRSPQIIKKKAFRELTDVLVWDDSHICLIESKVMSVYNKDENRSSERFSLGIEKEIDTAISQLSGASKIINCDKVIYKQDKTEIKIDNKKNLDMYGVILLSEMYPFLKYQDLSNKLIDIQRKYNIKIHIIDLRELVRLASIQGIPRSIHLNLNIRWQTFLEQRTPFIRGKFPKTI